MLKLIIYHIAIIVIIYLLLFRKESNKAFLVNSIIALSFFYIIYNYLSWTFLGSIYFKYFYVIYFVIIFLLSFKYGKIIDKSKLSIWYKIGKYTSKVALIFFISFFLIFDNSSQNNISYETINLNFPLKNGNYVIVHGGNNELLNYHIGLEDRIQHRAFDIGKLDKYGSVYSSQFSNKSYNEDFYIYGDSVFSPCAGIITFVRRHEKDHDPGLIEDFDLLPSNKVTIKNGENFIVLVHLKYNSIVVDSLDTVNTGDFIGLIGNSGHSSGPHLHIHAMDKFNGPLEIIFNKEEYKRNDIIRK